ncbi:conjugal transfer TraA domain protein [Orientia tsutsugamushi str. Sido]|nr:conjugal transfer TraA domain protein [Orientia tsutsugamushi str. Sido]
MRVKHFIIPELEMLHEKIKEIINAFFAKLALPNRVDKISTVLQVHIGITRVRDTVLKTKKRNNNFIKKIKK